jgi:hypothetical protein
MTVQSRLQGVYRQYKHDPLIPFATAEILRAALYAGYAGSAYFSGAHRPDGLMDDIAALSGRPVEAGYPLPSMAEAVAYYFQNHLGAGQFYSPDEPASVSTKYDALIPWVAKVAAREGDSGVKALLRRDVLSRIADWASEERPDIMRLSLKQVLHRERRWHAAMSRKRKVARVSPAEIVMRFEDGWTVHQLRTAEQLASEGELLEHCVGGHDYARRCAEGKIEIYSMRDPDGISRYTIEVWPGARRAIHQVKGLKNKRPRNAADCARLLSFLDQLPNVAGVDEVMDVEHCLKKSGRWRTKEAASVRRNRRTSRRRTSRRASV